MIQIIPSIQLLGNKVVSFENGDLARMRTFDTDIMDYVQDAQISGIKRICLTDISGARSNAPRTLDILKTVSETTALRTTFGGGIKSRDALKKAMEAGADHFISSSIALLQPNVFSYWAECYGWDNIIFSLDFTTDGLAVKGWKEKKQLDLRATLKNCIADGIKKVILRDVTREGTMQGPDFDFCKSLAEEFPKIKFGVRGGISSMEDIEKLEEIGICSAFIGTAILEEKLTFSQINNYYNRGKDEQETGEAHSGSDI